MAWTIFITTIPVEQADFHKIFMIYGLRWRIEIIFKSWKSHMQFAKLHNVSENQLRVILTARFIMIVIYMQNQKNQVFWGKRIRTHSWQFPQGGIDRGESPEQAMFRELHEEVGLLAEHVRIVARTRDWLRYEVPDRFIRRDARGHYKGQKQIWYLLQLVVPDWNLNLRATSHPEFDAWRWNEFWVPLEAVVEFKRGVYEMALTELSRFLPRFDNRPRPFRSANRLREPEGSVQDDGNVSVQYSFTQTHFHMELPPGATFDPDPQNSLDNPGA